MEHQPRNTLDDKYAVGRACAVCGELTLAVVHVEDLPDYVSCSNCGSGFILSSAGDWAMFGSVSSSFPETRQMVLKRWTTLEAVAAMASSERATDQSTDRGPDTTTPFGIGAKTSSDIQETTPPFGLDGMDSASENAETPPFGIGELDEFVPESSNGHSDPIDVAAPTIAEVAGVSEPEPGRRYVVTLAQKHVEFPTERCAHCLRRPAPRNLLVSAGHDSELVYEIPICQSCHERASARSEEQRSAKLVAHLSSILIAGALIVGVLASGLIAIGDLSAADIVVLATLGLVGYAVPVMLLLRRSSNLPSTEDAQFVRSTLRLRKQGFGWRNRGYAELFSSANSEILLGDLIQLSEEGS